MAGEVCSTCNETKEAGQFSRDTQQADGLKSNCKTCENNREPRHDVKEPTVETKVRLLPTPMLC